MFFPFEAYNQDSSPQNLYIYVHSRLNLSRANWQDIMPSGRCRWEQVYPSFTLKMFKFQCLHSICKTQGHCMNARSRLPSSQKFCGNCGAENPNFDEIQGSVASGAKSQGYKRKPAPIVDMEDALISTFWKSNAVRRSGATWLPRQETQRPLWGNFRLGWGDFLYISLCHGVGVGFLYIGVWKVACLYICVFGNLTLAAGQSHIQTRICWPSGGGSGCIWTQSVLIEREPL